MEKTTAWIIGIVVVILIALGIWYGYSHNTASNYSTQQQPSQQTGQVYFALADAAVNMGSVTAVNVTVDAVYLHSQSQGWVTISSSPQTFNLLDLKASGKAQVLAQANVAADTYDQAWVHVAQASVT